MSYAISTRIILQAGIDIQSTDHMGIKLISSIALNGSEKERPVTRLRWYVVDEVYQYQDLEHELLTKPLDSRCK